jgi:hypothetical protein
VERGLPDWRRGSLWFGYQLWYSGFGSVGCVCRSFDLRCGLFRPSHPILQSGRRAIRTALFCVASSFGRPNRFKVADEWLFMPSLLTRSVCVGALPVCGRRVGVWLVGSSYGKGIAAFFAEADSSPVPEGALLAGLCGLSRH